MMDRWTYRKLRDVVSFVNDGDWIESRHQSQSGIRLIQTGNIGDGVFKAKDDKPHYISEETFSQLGCTEVIEGDCLVSRLPDPVGRACIVPNIGGKMITAVDCTILRFKPSMLPSFFVYYSRSKHYHREIVNNTTGTTRKRISRKNLESVSVPFPPLCEQERVVAELDLLSGVLNKQMSLLKELDILANSVFYDMFGNPVENERGWNSELLGALTTLYNGRAFKPTDWSDSGLPIVRIQNLNNPQAVFNCYNGFVEEAYLLHGGELLYAWSGTPGTSFGAHIWSGNDAVLNQHIFKVAFDETRLTKVYFLYYLNLSVQSLFEKTHGGVGLQHITKGTLMAQVVPLPPLSLQRLFAEKIDTIEQQKRLINLSIAETRKLFDFTMDKYFG